jgi:hypothetical protein
MMALGGGLAATDRRYRSPAPAATQETSAPLTPEAA